MGDTVYMASKGNNTLLPICHGRPNNICSSMEMTLLGNTPEVVRFGPYYTRGGNSWSFQPESQTTLPVTEPESDGYYVSTQRLRCFDSAHYSMQDSLLDTMGGNCQGIETPERNETLPDNNAFSEMDMLSSKDFETMPRRFETLRHGERIMDQHLPTQPQWGFNSQDDLMNGHRYPQNGIAFSPLPYRSASRPDQSPDYRMLENVSIAFSSAKKPFPEDHLSRELQEPSGSPLLSTNTSLIQEPSRNPGTGPRVFFTSSAQNLEGTTTPVTADGFNATTQLRLDLPQTSDLYISKSLEEASSLSSKSPAALTPMSGTSATDSPTENSIPKAQTFVWDVKSGREVIEYVHKRPRTDEENNHRKFVRDNGGACDECRKTHRKCDHPQHTQETKTRYNTKERGTRSNPRSKHVSGARLKHVPFVPELPPQSVKSQRGGHESMSRDTVRRMMKHGNQSQDPDTTATAHMMQPNLPADIRGLGEQFRTGMHEDTHLQYPDTEHPSSKPNSTDVYFQLARTSDPSGFVNHNFMASDTTSSTGIVPPVYSIPVDLMQNPVGQWTEYDCPRFFHSS